jgi:uncharacterized protein YdbL (DUF1318 family)
MKTLFFRTCLVLFSFGLFAATAARAEDLGAIRARMAERLPKIDTLKASGAVGENNRGLLEVRDGGGDSASVVSEENADREKVYAAIAQQAGSNADQVGRQRAKKIAENSASGVWLQKQDGSWYRK